MWPAAPSLIRINAPLSHSWATHAVPTFVRPEQTKAGTATTHTEKSRHFERYQAGALAIAYQ